MGADVLMFLQYAKEAWIWEDDGCMTGAVALYERVGMHVDTCGVAFEKTLE